MTRVLNPFDPAAPRLDQNFVETVRVKKLLTTVQVGKPGRQEFVRVHADPAFRLTPAAIIEMKEDRETYIVDPIVASELKGEYAEATIYLTVNRQGVPSLWPVKLPGADGKYNEWHRSSAEAAEQAMKNWVRVKANMSLRAYEISQALADLPEPVWPDLSFAEILQIAFRGYRVDRLDHPLIQRLRGAS